MRILHTSDWHLGRTLHGEDLHAHHAAFLDHLVDLVREREVDVVLVAGDVYDRAVPGVPSVRLLGDALARLSALATVIVTPGNHDSAARLGFASALLRDGLRILASVEALDVPVVIEDADGPVAFYGVPYLDPDAVRASLVAPGSPPLPRSHEAVLGAAMDRVRADAAGRPEARVVVVAHAFVTGAAPSESERDIRVGGFDQVPASVFSGADYVALGHLHGAQEVRAAGSARPVIRYSGSPLAFSFGERMQRKSSALVELAADGSTTVELVDAPVPRWLAEVTGTLAEIVDGRHADLADAWLRVHVTDPVHPPHLVARVREALPHALVVLHEPEGRVEGTRSRVVDATTDPLEVAADFVAYATGAPPTEAEALVLRQAYELALAADRSA
ncbi:exonuclease SbcCD subunit D [Clavibacter nebraskensis]|uniref:Nuclease SbcCD subunit D n=3 Tax=Clavibacter TaxID=1573 RepID=A0A399QCK3_9MICO|nr:exonuclease SbcCD subunit D C-terminal domain-containing protein [Clavibacter nebraskensis]KXU21539.1 exonuclease sbcCD subunit D [Clavibacter nebraskensis]OAH19127.1 exonuclease sbcCD subunit D [Clavibacter nebraskensis]QGV65917.1 exonuclease SbcCD subunit D C-terminal domain-containing protein [Clavibacter nebraskensis]QGV68714.1 exonuclease SbcCD subunit D C-terminal domain-containing protein [Clavibacter nebraskensis]QGV71505.1 exonuclease SbcCD subunit D C-terminal domain-containing pr